jgi:tRNA(Arg) A34 adenosine deaminase TadA
LSAKEIRDLQVALSALSEDEEAISVVDSMRRGAVVLNPINGKVVTSSFVALRLLCSSLVPSTESDRCADTEFDRERYCPSLHTPSMLCIEGVAAMVRQGHSSGVLGPDPYLCSGLDLFLSEEPDLMSAMALVHSRIRRVYFRREDEAQGALSSSWRIHCLPSLNHHFRTFKLFVKDAEPGR